MARTALDIKAQKKAAAGLRPRSIDIHLRTYGSRTQNDATGLVTLGTATNDLWFASPPLAVDQAMVNGDTIRSDDAMMIMTYRDTDDSVIPEEPERALVEVVLNNGTASEEVWSIVNVTVHKAGNEPCAYEVQLRKE